jgi:hypothetical protein
MNDEMEDDEEKVNETEVFKALAAGTTIGTVVAGTIIYLLASYKMIGLAHTANRIWEKYVNKTAVASVSTEDFNGDGLEDVVVSHPDGSRTLYSKREDGSYQKEGRMIPAENHGE